MADSKKSSIKSASNNSLKKIKSNSSTNNKIKKKVAPIPKQNLIHQYLKKKDTDITNQSTNCEQHHDDSDEKNDFYEKCLKSKFNECALEKNCHQIKQSLKRKLDINKRKESQIQESIAMCLEINAQKDEKIKSLESQAEQIHQLSATSTSTSTNANIQTNVVNTPILFEQFNKILAENQLSTLRSIDKSTKGDSNFILNCVRFVYSDDLAKLAHKSVTGASKSEPKAPITPQKLIQMKSMYVERLNDLEMEKWKKKSGKKNSIDMFIERLST